MGTGSTGPGPIERRYFGGGKFRYFRHKITKTNFRLLRSNSTHFRSYEIIFIQIKNININSIKYRVYYLKLLVERYYSIRSLAIISKQHGLAMLNIEVDLLSISTDVL